MVTPNRILLKGNPRYDEVSLDADVYPGMAIKQKSNNRWIPNNTLGSTGNLAVVLEQALYAGTINTKIPSGEDGCPIVYPKNGDELLVLLQNGQSVVTGQGLMPAADGTWVAGSANLLYQIVADSANITNTNVETVFSNGTYTIPANTLQVGDVIRVKGKAVVTGQNSTNTHQVKVYLGTTAIADFTALALTPNDVVEFDLTLTVRSIGASGAYIESGNLSWSVGGTWSSKGNTLASTTVDTTVAEAITVKSTASATSAGNVIKLSEFAVQKNTASGPNKVNLYAQETIDNSLGGTAYNSSAWIRGLVV